MSSLTLRVTILDLKSMKMNHINSRAAPPRQASLIRSLLSMAVVVTTVAPAALAVEDQEDSQTRPTAIEQTIIDAINRQRREADVSPLRVNQRLMRAGRIHANNMASLQQGGHVLEKVKPEWRTPEARLADVGYRGFTWGENIFWGSTQADEIVGVWMKSKGHRENLLNPRFNEIGLGQTGRRFDSYVCAVFGAGSLPAKTPTPGRSVDEDKSVRPRAIPHGARERSANRERTLWRYRWHNGRWWYWLESGRWVYWSNGQWVRPEQSGFLMPNVP